MVESCGTQISAPAQVANALNRETAQSQLPAIKLNYYITNIQKQNKKYKKQKTHKNFTYYYKSLIMVLILISFFDLCSANQSCPKDCAMYAQNDKLVFFPECGEYTEIHYDYISPRWGKLVPISLPELIIATPLTYIYIIWASFRFIIYYVLYVTKLLPRNIGTFAIFNFEFNLIIFSVFTPCFVMPYYIWQIMLLKNYKPIHCLLCFYPNFITKEDRERINFVNFLSNARKLTLVQRIKEQWFDNQITDEINFSKFRLQAGDTLVVPEDFREDEPYFEQDYSNLEIMIESIHIQSRETIYSDSLTNEYPSKYIPKVNKSMKKNKPRKFKIHVEQSVKNLSKFRYQAEENEYSFNETFMQAKQTIFAKFGESQQTKFFVHTCESVAITAHYLSLCKTKADVFMAFANLTKHHLEDRALCSSKNLQKINRLIGSLFVKQMELQGSTDELMFTFRNLLNNYATIKKSEVFKKVYRLFNYFLALELFQNCGLPLTYEGYTRLETEIHKKKYSMGPDFIYSLLDTMLFLCERGVQCYAAGSIEPMFHSGASYADWYDKTVILQRQSKNIHNPTLNEISEHEFLKNLDEVIEKGNSIYKFASSLHDTDRRIVNQRLNDMMMIKSEILCLRFANESREVPFSVLIHGESGIGKSSVKDLLYHAFCKAKNLPSDDEYKYTRNPISEFWDGFRSSMHSLFMDDVAFMNPNKAPNGDQSCLEFIQVINPVPFVPNQAALEFKGKTPFRCQFVCATTNVKDLNAHHYFSHPSAIQRRFPYIITPKPLEKYTTEGMLDSTKTPPPEEGRYSDLWTFTVEKVYTVPISGRQRNAKIVQDPDLVDMDLKKFLKWYVGAINTHFSNQSKMTDSIKHMKNIKSCQLCKLPLYMCECTFQSSDIVVNSISLIEMCLRYFIAYKFFIGLQNFFQECKNTKEEIRNSLNEAKEKIQEAQEKIQETKDQVDNTITDTKNKIQGAKNEMREYFSNLGDRVKSSFAIPRYFGVLASIIGTGLIFWKLKRNLMSFQASDGVAPEGKEEKENPWFKNDYEITDFDITRKTLSWKNMEKEELIRKLKNNTMLITQTYRCGTKVRERFGNALALEGHTVILNLHTLKMDEDVLFLSVTRQNHADGITKNIQFQIPSADIKVFPEHDIAVLTLTQLPPFKRITDLFAKSDFNGTGKGFLLLKDRSGEDKKFDFIRAKRTNRVDFSHFEKNSRVIHDIYTAQFAYETKEGYCGAPYILMTPQGPIILGIHVAGYDAVGQCLFFDTETIKKFLPSNEIIVQGDPMLSSQSAERNVGSLSKKSVFRYIQSGSATLHGSFSGYKITPKSRVEKTPMNPFLQQRGYTTKYTHPVMGGWKPWRIAALDLVNPVVNVDHEVLNIITTQFTQTILEDLPSDELKKLEVYDDFTALNGAAGVTYVDKMNRNTSAGNPWKKSKKFFLFAMPPKGDNLDPVKVTSEISDRVKEIIGKYISGERVHPNFCAHLKDEPVTFAKQELGKTRVFSGAPFDWSLVVRKYFLSSIRVLQRNKFTFEAAPGTICQSHEWGDIYRYLTVFGEHKIVAGDYKAYDKRMPPAFIIAAFNILINLCKETGNFDDDDIRIMRGIAEDTAYPLTDFNGDLVEFFGSNPSGHPLTVIINSLVNSLYLRYVYYIKNPDKEVLSFKKNVKLMTYGDDNIMGVSDDTPWFNHTSIQEMLSGMGITYTMADKTSKSVPYINIREASFLKRTWKFNNEIDEYLCPLEHDSIEKSLMVWTRSKTICWEEQCIAVVASASREYFFYGESTFNKRIKILKEMITHLDLNHYLTYDKNGECIQFPSYKYLIEQFQKAGH